MEGFICNRGLENLTSDLNGAFASGRVAMIVASTSNLTTIHSMVGDRFEVGVAPFPMVDKRQPPASSRRRSHLRLEQRFGQ
jgi:ABC-type glycerol-3-phosphate transport system substrate-binding protein